ncbi:universal stress protein [Nonomuraea maheshkhaliensis]|uniref:Universal stress protein n=1 Tax=Nonomuraea maheshkhaliensis TaxID=419590 RepID=A0ABP4RJF1_9ACTN
MDEPVVVGIDGSHAADLALGWAADDAARRGRRLRIVHVREPWAGERPLTAASDHQTRTEQDLAMLAVAADRAHGRHAGLRVATALVTGGLIERLRSEAESADTLVLGSRGLSAPAGLLMRAAGDLLAGRVHCPVVVVRSAARSGRGEVVVGYDGSPGAEAALAYALEQARAREVRLRALYAEPVLALVTVSLGHEPAAHPRALPLTERTLAERLAPWRQSYPEVEITESLAAGHPLPALARASRRAALVVVGCRGLHGLASVLPGSVSRGVLRRVDGPVAVVAAPASNERTAS